jgi:hypothetical protein
METDMKRGGKVKGGGKAKAKAKAKVTATATNTVHVHVTRRQSTKGKGISRVANGNIAMERQLGAMFQQLASFHPPMYASYPPLVEQGAKVLPQEVELPHQQKNIINLADLAREPIIEELYRGRFAREEWNRQEQFSHASHLPSSIDHGDPAEIRSLPFSRLSYGDENNQELREENEQRQSLSSLGQSRASLGQPIIRPVIRPRFPPLHRLQPKGYVYGLGLGYTKEGKPRTNPIRNDEYSEYSAGFAGAGMNPARPGRQYHIRPFQ